MTGVLTRGDSDTDAPRGKVAVYKPGGGQEEPAPSTLLPDFRPPDHEPGSAVTPPGLPHSVRAVLAKECSHRLSPGYFLSFFFS